MPKENWLISCVETSGLWNVENILKCAQLFTNSVCQAQKLLIIMCEKNFVDSKFSIESSPFCVLMTDVSSVSCTKDLADRMTSKSLVKLEDWNFFQLCLLEMDVLIQCSSPLLAFFNVHSVDIQKKSRN